MSQPIVCVTGATGFVAPHIIIALLKKGYIVRGTVRSIADTEKYNFLLQIARDLGASERLSLVEADNLKPGSHDAAFAGCTYVIHNASPFILGMPKDVMKELIMPAVAGTENVLTSVAKAGTVKRVVVTSSVAAIYGNSDDKTVHFYNEDDWNTSSTMKENPYHLSKTLAEKKAWEMANAQSQYTLVTVNPGFVMGPSLNGRDDGASVQFLRDMLSGKNRYGVPHIEYTFVDVRDVAEAHVAAMEKESAKGRYICTKESLSMLEVAQLLRERFPHNPLPTHTIPKPLMYVLGPLSGMSLYFVRHNVDHSLAFDNKKIRNELGITFARPLRETFADMAESLVAHGVVERDQ